MKEFKDLEFIEKPEIGINAKMFFDNGYGISVIRNIISYTSKDKLDYEIAVLKGNEKDWDICYDTPITSNVLGYLSPEEVTEIMIQIQKYGNKNTDIVEIKEINQISNIAIVLHAYDYNSQGETIKISYGDLFKAYEGQRWIAKAGNMHRDCVTFDEITVIKITDKEIILRHTEGFVGDYPNYEYTEDVKYLILQK